MNYEKMRSKEFLPQRREVHAKLAKKMQCKLPLNFFSSRSLRRLGVFAVEIDFLHNS
jgi:hypothetical protein